MALDMSEEVCSLDLEFLPNRKLIDTSYCGYIEFQGGKGNYLNEILREGETQSHDKLEKTMFKKIIRDDFPSLGMINLNFLT